MKSPGPWTEFQAIGAAQVTLEWLILLIFALYSSFPSSAAAINFTEPVKSKNNDKAGQDRTNCHPAKNVLHNTLTCLSESRNNVLQSR